MISQEEKLPDQNLRYVDHTYPSPTFCSPLPLPATYHPHTTPHIKRLHPRDWDTSNRYCIGVLLFFLFTLEEDMCLDCITDRSPDRGRVCMEVCVRVFGDAGLDESTTLTDSKMNDDRPQLPSLVSLSHFPMPFVFSLSPPSFETRRKAPT